MESRGTARPEKRESKREKEGIGRLHKFTRKGDEEASWEGASGGCSRFTRPKRRLGPCGR